LFFGAAKENDGVWDVRASWYKRGSAVIMGWRREYVVLDGEDGGEEKERREWWNMIMVGVGSISNLYVPIGDFCEFDMGITTKQGLAVALEEGIELVAI